MPNPSPDITESKIKALALARKANMKIDIPTIKVPKKRLLYIPPLFIILSEDNLTKDDAAVLVAVNIPIIKEVKPTLSKCSGIKELKIANAINTTKEIVVAINTSLFDPKIT